eukprot:scaffold27125_cov90-Isochrysis_galbana.AAC.1
MLHGRLQLHRVLPMHRHRLPPSQTVLPHRLRQTRLLVHPLPVGGEQRPSSARSPTATPWAAGRAGGGVVAEFKHRLPRRKLPVLAPLHEAARPGGAPFRPRRLLAQARLPLRYRVRRVGTRTAGNGRDGREAARAQPCPAHHRLQVVLAILPVRVPHHPLRQLPVYLEHPAVQDVIPPPHADVGSGAAEDGVPVVEPAIVLLGRDPDRVRAQHV